MFITALQKQRHLHRPTQQLQVGVRGRLEGTVHAGRISHLINAEKEAAQRKQYVLPPAAEIMN